MIQRTLAQVRPQLTAVAGTTGMSITDSRFIDRLNLCQEELMNEGDFPGVVDRWHVRFDEATGYVSLPYHLDQMMQATVDHQPRTIVSPWFEFVSYGPGYQDDYDARGNLRWNWIDVITDRGEHPVRTQIPEPEYLTGPWVLRVYATVDEDTAGVPPEINIQGEDPDGEMIRTLDGSTYINGVNVAIDFDEPYVQTTQEFSKITAVVKPTTNSYVRLTAWNGTVEVELSNYAYNETTPSYRHYYVPALRGNCSSVCGTYSRVLLARCRKRFVPVRADNDVLIISNINALKSMVVAQWKRDAGDYEAYAIQKQTAVEILKKEAMAYRGKSRVPAISFTRGFGLGVLPEVR